MNVTVTFLELVHEEVVPDTEDAGCEEDIAVDEETEVMELLEAVD